MLFFSCSFSFFSNHLCVDSRLANSIQTKNQNKPKTKRNSSSVSSSEIARPIRDVDARYCHHRPRPRPRRRRRHQCAWIRFCPLNCSFSLYLVKPPPIKLKLIKCHRIPRERSHIGPSTCSKLSLAFTCWYQWLSLSICSLLWCLIRTREFRYHMGETITKKHNLKYLARLEIPTQLAPMFLYPRQSQVCSLFW